MDVKKKLTEIIGPFVHDDWYSDVITDKLISNGVTIMWHGQWLYDSRNGKYFCSACDDYALSLKKDALYGDDLYDVCLTDYCPNCGAKMDGERS